MLPTLHTLRDIADNYGWSMDTLYDYAKRGELPASKVGRTYFVTDEGLATFLANRATG